MSCTYWECLSILQHAPMRSPVAEERYSVRQVEEHAIQIPSEKMEYFSYFWLLTLE